VVVGCVELPGIGPAITSEDSLLNGSGQSRICRAAQPNALIAAVSHGWRAAGEHSGVGLVKPRN
jgi:hypothetical protein